MTCKCNKLGNWWAICAREHGCPNTKGYPRCKRLRKPESKVNHLIEENRKTTGQVGG